MTTLQKIENIVYTNLLVAINKGKITNKYSGYEIEYNDISYIIHKLKRTDMNIFIGLYSTSGITENTELNPEQSLHIYYLLKDLTSEGYEKTRNLNIYKELEKAFKK